MRIVTVVGTRPQFIKAAFLSKSLKNFGIEETLIHTGQHFDPSMSSSLFQELDLDQPAINLGIHGLSHSAMTGRMLEAIADRLKQLQPKLVMVYGDCNSTLAGALAARQLGIQVHHVEAGLRSFKTEMAEELNRTLVDRMSQVLYAPTRQAIKNLKNEGLEKSGSKVYFSGDIMLDAVRKLNSATLFENFQKLSDKFTLNANNYVLCTIHRRENISTINRLKEIVSAIQQLSKSIRIVFPIHPATKKKWEDAGLPLPAFFVQPLGYMEMNALIANSLMVITDSGGVQKESFFHGKRSIVVREATEYVEILKGNYCQLCNPFNIVKTASNLETTTFNPPSFFGEGNAAEIISTHLLEYLNK